MCMVFKETWKLVLKRFSLKLSQSTHGILIYAASLGVSVGGMLLVWATVWYVPQIGPLFDLRDALSIQRLVNWNKSIPQAVLNAD